MDATTPLSAVAATMGLRHETATYNEHGQRYHTTVKYGFDLAFARKCSQAPYFTITGEIRRGGHRGKIDSCGMQHDIVRAHLPHLAPLLRWHLASTTGPLHYVANGTYWYLMAHGRGRWKNTAGGPDPLEAFRRAVIFGAAPGDDDFNPSLDPVVALSLNADLDADLDADIAAALEVWLVKRLDAVMDAFATDMTILATRQPEGV